MEITFRLMEKEDAEALYAIGQICGFCSWSLSSYENEYKNPLASYYVALADDVIAGFAGIWCVVDEAEVMNVGVLPEYRGYGIGFKLMETLWEQAKQEGCTAMTLEVKESNLAAIHLYKKLGFYATGIREDYYFDHSSGIMMRRA